MKPWKASLRFPASASKPMLVHTSVVTRCAPFAAWRGLVKTSRCSREAAATRAVVEAVGLRRGDVAA